MIKFHNNVAISKFLNNISELVLKQEQEEYQREGIAWQNIEYFNNKVGYCY